MLMVLLVGLTLLSFFVYITRPQRLARLTSNLLADMTGAHVQIESARFSLDGTIKLRRLQMSVPDLDPDAAKLFEAHKVVIKHSIFSLARGHFNPLSMTFFQPTLYRTEILGDDKFNFEYLINKDRDKQLKLPPHLPQVIIREGQIIFAEHDKQQHTLLLGKMHLNGTLTESLDDSHAYFFNLRQQLADDKDGPTLNGSFHLKSLRVDGELQKFFIEGPHRNILPSRMRAWWDQLSPEGSFPKVTFGYDPEIGAHAVLEVQNVALTLPYLEVNSRMTVKTGKFTLANETITFHKLIGRVENFHYEINGRVNGFSTDSPFALTARMRGDLPDQPQYLPALPLAVQKTFHRFTPSGKLSAMVLLERKQPGGELIYDGQVEITNAKLLDARFPYPLDNVRGEFRFDNHQVRVVSLRGDGPTGAKAVVRGTVTPPGPDAAVDMTISGINVPIDQILIRAFKPHQQALVKKLLDKKRYATLTDKDQGVIKSSEQHRQWSESLSKLKISRKRLQAAKNIDEQALLVANQSIVELKNLLARPLFDLGGVVNATARVRRPKGANQQFTTDITVEISNVSGLMTKWPYPIKVTSGKIHLHKHKIILEDLITTGITGGMGKITGRYIRESDTSHRWSPKIKFLAADYPLDNVLLASLPPNATNWVNELELTGLLDVAGELFRRDDGEIDFIAHTKILQGAARPYDGNYRIDNLTADLTISRDQLQIHNAQGKHAHATINVQGEVIMRSKSPEAPGAALRITADKLDFAQPVLDLIPPTASSRVRIKQIFDKHQPQGTFDAEFIYRRTTGKPIDYVLIIKPKRLDINVQKQRAKLTDVSGSLIFSPLGLTIEDLKASYDTGQLGLAGTISPGDQPTVQLTFNAKKDEFCPVTRAFMPKGVLDTLNKLELAAGYQVNQAQLRIAPDTTGNRMMSFSCQAKLLDATATIGLPVTDLTGSLTLTADGPVGAPFPHIDFSFVAEQGRLSDRLITDLNLHASTDAKRNVLVIDSLQGNCYGGKIVGRGEADINGKRQYQIELSAQNVMLRPFLKPKTIKPSDDDSILSAQLSLLGRFGKDNTRFGRGAFHITNAKMYRVPLIMAVMHLVNLSLPTSSSFNEAAAEFLVDGNDVMFESIRFDAPSLQMSGVGMMDYASSELDLELDLRNPTAVNFGKLSELINVFKDELIHIHVGGTLDQPKASLKSLKSIRQGWTGIFSNVRRKLGQLNPLASASKHDPPGSPGPPATPITPAQ